MNIVLSMIKLDTLDGLDRAIYTYSLELILKYWIEKIKNKKKLSIMPPTLFLTPMFQRLLCLVFAGFCSETSSSTGFLQYKYMIDLLIEPKRIKL